VQSHPEETEEKKDNSSALNISPKIVNLIRTVVQKKLAYQGFKKYSFIDIEKQSKKNLSAIQRRLKTCADLPGSIIKTIQSEKTRPDSVLTPAELTFYRAVLSQPMILNHATQSTDGIIKSGYLYSQKTLKKKIFDMWTTAMEQVGQDDFVFFSGGFESNTAISPFIKQADVFYINLDRLAATDPATFATLHTGGRAYTYIREDINQPVILQSKNSSTRLYSRYQMSFSPIAGYNHEIVFKRADGDFKKNYFRAEEVSAGRHIKPYQTLILIECLRYVDNETRIAILNSPNSQLHADFYASIFAPDKTEFYIPREFKLRNDTSVSWFKRNDILRHDEQEIMQCIDDDDTNKLAVYLKSGIEIQLYRYDKYGFQQLTLLNLAVIQKHYAQVELLMVRGANPSLNYLNRQQVYYGLCANRTALQDAILMKDEKLIKLLCEPTTKTKMILSGALVSEVEMFSAIAIKINKEIFMFLLERYKIFFSLEKSLLVAAFYENCEAMEILISAGAKVNASAEIRRDESNCHIIASDFCQKTTALILAARLGRLASVNHLVKIADVNAKEGREQPDYSSLAAALRGLEQCLGNEVVDTETEYSIIENKYYGKVKKPDPKVYCQIIDCLMGAGADVDYLLNFGDKFSLAMQRYQLYNSQSVLVRINLINNDIESKIEDIPQDNYALITGCDAKGNKTVLLATQDKRLMLPGGLLPRKESQQENNEKIIRIVAVQTGMNLEKEILISPALVSASTPFVNRVAVYQYQLSQPVENYTLSNNAAYYDGSNYKLMDLKFVKLSDIQLTSFNYNGIELPLCQYRGHYFKPFFSAAIAQMMGIDKYSHPACLDMAYKISAAPNSLISLDIKNKNITNLISLLDSGIKDLIFTDDIVKRAIESGDIKFVNALLKRGFLSKNPDGLYHYFQHLDKAIISEDIVLAVCLAHQHIITAKYYIESFANLLGELGYLKVIAALAVNDTSLLHHAGIGATKKSNLYCLQYIVGKHSFPDKNAEVMTLLQCIQINRDQQPRYYEKIFEVINFLLQIYTGDKTPSEFLLSHLGNAYRDIVDNKMPEDLQRKWLQLIVIMIDRKYFDVQDHLLYTHYRGLKLWNNHKAAEALFRVIYQIPIIEMIYKDEKDKSGIEFIKFLNAHSQNAVIKRIALDALHVLDDDRQDDAGDTRLHQAVKLQSLSVVKWLLETRNHLKPKVIDIPDKNNSTPLESAITSGNNTIAKLLIIYGADITPGTVSMVKGRNNDELLQFINNRKTLSSILFQQVSAKKTDCNIMCLDIPYTDYSLEHILHLAELIKASSDVCINDLKIAFVVPKNTKSEVKVAPFHRFLSKIFPDHHFDFSHQSPADIMKLIQYLIPVFPIKVFLDVEEDKLARLFAECEYAFYPHSEGLSFNNNSVIATLKNGCILYSHEGKQTPCFLKKEGEYSQAVTLYDHDDYCASYILTNISFRIENKKSHHGIGNAYNDITRDLAADLVNYVASFPEQDISHSVQSTSVLPPSTMDLTYQYKFFNTQFLSRPMKDEQALTILKKAFPGSHFASGDADFAKANINIPDPKEKTIALFRLMTVSHKVIKAVRTPSLLVETAISVAQALLALGADLNICHFRYPYKSAETEFHDFNNYNSAPLHYYLRTPSYLQTPIVLWLIKNVVNVNVHEANENKLTPLMLACDSNVSMEVFSALLKRKADPMLRNAARQNAIIYAANSNPNTNEKLDAMIEAVINSAIPYFFPDDIGRLYELEQLTRSHRIIDEAYARVCKKLIEAAIVENNYTAIELILCYLQNKHHAYVLESIDKKQAWLGKVEREHKKFSAFLTALYENDLPRVCAELNDNCHEPLWYYYLNSGLFLGDSVCTALIIDYKITDNFIEDALYDAMRSGNGERMAILLATLTDCNRLKMRGYVLDKMQRIGNSNATWVNNISDALTLYEQASAEAQKLNDFMLANKTNLFKAVYINKIDSKYRSNMQTCFSVSNTIFIQVYIDHLIVESKILRNQVRLQKDPAARQKFITSEAELLKSISLFNGSFKNIANHKMAKRALTQGRSIADLVDIRASPYTIQTLARRMYVESSNFDQAKFITDLTQYYEHADLKPILDVAAHGANLHPNFNIVFLKADNAGNYVRKGDFRTMGQYNSKHSICVARSSLYNDKVCGTLFHELIHYVEMQLNNNGCNPYRKFASTGLIAKATMDTMKLIYQKLRLTVDASKSSYELGKALVPSYSNATLDANVQEVLAAIFALYESSYSESDQYIEICTKYAELLPLKIPDTVLRGLISPLIDFHRRVTLKEAEDYLAATCRVSLKNRM